MYCSIGNGKRLAYGSKHIAGSSLKLLHGARVCDRDNARLYRRRSMIRYDLVLPPQHGHYGDRLQSRRDYGQPELTDRVRSRSRLARTDTSRPDRPTSIED